MQMIGIVECFVGSPLNDGHHASHDWTAEIDSRAWRRGYRMAARGARAAGGQEDAARRHVSALQQSSPTWATFMRRMAELGYQEGKTFVFDLVSAASEEDYENGSRTLAAREPDLILATGPESALKSALAVT